MVVDLYHRVILYVSYTEGKRKPLYTSLVPRGCCCCHRDGWSSEKKGKSSNSILGLWKGASCALHHTAPVRFFFAAVAAAVDAILETTDFIDDVVHHYTHTHTRRDEDVLLFVFVFISYALFQGLLKIWPRLFYWKTADRERSKN